MSSSLRENLITALGNALEAQNKQQREHGENSLTEALKQNAAQVLPELIQIAGDSSLGPVSELAAIRSKNYLLSYTGDASIWDEHIVPPTRLAVFNQLPTATATSRRVLLASLRLLLQDNPWPELIDMAGPVLQNATQTLLQNLQNNTNNNNNTTLFNTIICALEAILVMVADYRIIGLVEKEIQDYVGDTLLPLLPPLFSLGRTEVASLSFALFHSLVATNRPPSLTDDVLSAWMNEMLSFPEKFAAVSQQSRKSFEHYIKAVYNIAVVAIQIVDVSNVNKNNNNNNNSSKKKKNKGGKKLGNTVNATPTVYGYANKFTNFFCRFLNYVATMTMNSSESTDNDDRDTREMMRNPALYSIRFLLNCASFNTAHSSFENVDLQQLVTRDLFAFVPFNEEDSELWEDDPREYLRMISDPDSQEISLRFKATQLIIELCKPRKTRPPLAPLDAVLKGLSDHLRNANSAPKQTDGAIFVLANLRPLIKQQPQWWNGVGSLLSELVAPLLNHKNSVIRAKAIWLCGAFSDAPFQDTSMFNNMVYGVMRRIEDNHPGVRSSVVTSVVQFLAQEKARPLIYELLHPIVDECLRLLDSVSSESVVLSLQCLVECFGPELRSSIANICDRLVQTVLATNFELNNADDPHMANNGDEDDGEGGYDENNNDQSAGAKKRRSASARIDSLTEIIINSMKTLDGALEAMASNPSLVRALQPRIGEMLQQLFKSEVADMSVVETASVLMATVLRYCVPANFSGADPECTKNFSSPDEHRNLIAPEIWQCLPMLERLVVEEGACEIFSVIARPIDHFISIIPLEFSGSNSSSLFDLLKTCNHMLSLIEDENADNLEGGNGGDDDYGMGGLVEDREIEGAPQILSSLLEHIRPVGNIQNDEAFNQIIDMLIKGILRTSKTQAGLKASLCVALLDCFIFDAQRTIRRLDSNYGGTVVFIQEFIKFYKAKKQTQFAKPAYRSKVVVLGLVSLLRFWIQTLGASMTQTIPLEGIRAILEVIVHAVRNERKENGKWLEKHSEENLQRHRNNNGVEEYNEIEDDEDDFDDEDSNNNKKNNKKKNNNNNNENEDVDEDEDDEDENGGGRRKKDITLGGGDDDDDLEDEYDDHDDDLFGEEEDDYDTPLNKINTAGALIDFLSTNCPIELINAVGVASLISKEELEDCANTSQNVLKRDRELLEIFEREEEERAAAMNNNRKN